MPLIDRSQWQKLKKAHGIGTGEAKVNMGKALDLYEKAWADKEASPEKLVKILNQVIRDAAIYRETIEKKYGASKKAFLSEFKAKIEDALLQDVKDLESIANPWKNMREEYRELLALSKDLGAKCRDPQFLSDKKQREQLLTTIGGIGNSIGINLNLLRDVYGDKKYGELKPAITAIAQANENCAKSACSTDSVRELLLAVAKLGKEFKKYGIA
jgi:hypothetical protein